MIERDQERFHEETWHLWYMWPHRVLLYENSGQEPMEKHKTKIPCQVFCNFPLCHRVVGITGILGVIDQY